MYIVVTFSLLCIFFTYLESKKQVKHGMKCGFILTTFLLAVHYDYGNDYMSYYNISQEIYKIPFDFEKIMNGDIYREPGWVILNYLFRPIGGFFMLVAVLSICESILIYKYIRRYVDKKWWVLAVCIYLFTVSIFLYSFSMLRQYLVMSVFFWLFPYIKERKWWFAIPVLFLSSFIHSSAAILIPFAFAGFIPLNNTRIIAITMSIIFALLLLGDQFLNTIFIKFMVIEQFSDYAETYDNGNVTSSRGIGFIINLIPFILSMVFLIKNKNNNRQNDQKLLVIISNIYYLIMPFATIILLVSRIGIYFSMFQIISLPPVFQYIYQRNNRFAIFCIFIFMALLIYSYILFFNVGVFAENYSSEFKTIFNQL